MVEVTGSFRLVKPRSLQQHILRRGEVRTGSGTRPDEVPRQHLQRLEVAFLERKFHIVEDSYRQGAELTPPFPTLGTADLREPARDPQGWPAAYTKPIVLLTDDQSVSAADAFAAVFQDNQRGLILGVRTNGGGGNNVQGPGGVYSHGEVGIENNLAVRNHLVTVSGYPSTPYVDNVGVQPDVFADLMTKENLLNGGMTFSRGMVTAVAAYVRRQNEGR